jgi:hypothetical protein
MTESQWTNKICLELIENGCLVYAAVGNKFSAAGWPDRHVILGSGEMFWLEFKSPDGKLSKQQIFCMRGIDMRIKHCAFVIRQNVPGELARIESIDGAILERFRNGLELRHLLKMARKGEV